MLPESLLTARAGQLPTTRSQEAYQAIREKIILLELPPASLIDESQLCAQLGLGRTPVREALIRLSFEHLVVILPRRGTMIADLNPADLRKLYELHLELEVYAVRLAAQRATAHEIEKMRNWVHQAQNRSKDLSDTALLDLDEGAHQLFYLAAHNLFLNEALKRLAGHTRRLCHWYASQYRLKTLPEAIVLLVEVIEYIIQGDASGAAEKMTRHISIFMAELLSFDGR